jgi:arachidonate 15-lipoxygenase
MYIFNYDYVPPIPMLDKVPKHEYFTPHYTAGRLASMAKLAPNMLIAKKRNLFDPLDNLDDYEDMFVLLDKPGVAENYGSDESFGEQRLTGVNPMSLRRIDAIPDGFPVTDAHLSQALGNGTTLERELKEGRLYFLDFPQLAHVKQGGVYRGHRKYLPKPRALFVWDRTRGRLWPVAIQVGERPGSRLFSPADASLDWFTAKLAVQIADATAQELGTHFARCHVAMGPFAVVTNRQLADNHPVFLLLRPHFRFMLYDNELGRTQFIQPEGPVEQMMAGTLEESIGISAAFYTEWTLPGAAFPTEIASRGMDDADTLPYYPFRDDGQLLWDAIGDFIDAYLALYYRTPEDVSGDPELQAWASELASKNGGRVAGMQETIDTPEALRDVLLPVIYTCAPLHSALNFAQYEYIGFVANMPYAAYHPIPEDGGVDMETLMRIMPPYAQAALQLKWTEILTSYHYDKLGFYDKPFDDPRAREVVERFQGVLGEIETRIEEANSKRPLAYNYLKPSRIINSINT